MHLVSQYGRLEIEDWLSNQKIGTKSIESCIAANTEKALKELLFFFLVKTSQQSVGFKIGLYKTDIFTYKHRFK